MTTETRSAPPGSIARGARVLGRSALVAAAGGLASALVALLASGGGAALAAVVGTALTVTVLLSGALVVDVVARQMPSLSLLVALMTYAIHVGLFALLLLAATEAGGLRDSVELPWLAGGVIATALVWTVAQIRLAVTTRIPAFDLPVRGEPASVPATSEGASRTPSETRPRGV